MNLIAYRTDGDPTAKTCCERVAEGTPAQVIVQLLTHLDTQQLHNLQAVELPRARSAAVMDPARVPPIVTPVPEVGFDDDRR